VNSSNFFKQVCFLFLVLLLISVMRVSKAQMNQVDLPHKDLRCQVALQDMDCVIGVHR